MSKYDSSTLYRRKLDAKQYSHQIDHERDENSRLHLEERWITLLNTISPNGLNCKVPPCYASLGYPFHNTAAYT